MYRLPIKTQFNSEKITKLLIQTSRNLATLNGVINIIPNKHILLNAMTLNEAKDSSEIEQIVTTHDELYEALVTPQYANEATKEVINYRRAIWESYATIQERPIISISTITEIQATIEPYKKGIRTMPGTKVVNAKTGKVIHTPPQTYEEIISYMDNLINYMNDDTYDELDPLIKLALIHYQFEAIHPFYDGNGRTGRILNVLYLVQQQLLDSPILYLSKYILRTKNTYYELLDKISQDEKYFEDWVIYILTGINESVADTHNVVDQILNAIDEYAIEIRNKLPKIYSRELVDALFFEFTTQINYIEQALGVTRKTASSYLQELEKHGFMYSEKKGRNIIYKNPKLYEVIQKAAE